MGTRTDVRVLFDRGVAVGIDLLACYVFVELPLVYVVSELAPNQFEALGAVGAVVSFVVLLPIYVTYSFAFEWRYGRTPGKVNRGLLVVLEDGRRCTLAASSIRNLLRYVDLVGVPPLVVGLVVALLADGRRLGDLAAGTVVVRARAPEGAGRAARAELDASASARRSEGPDGPSPDEPSGALDAT